MAPSCITTKASQNNTSTSTKSHAGKKPAYIGSDNDCFSAPKKTSMRGFEALMAAAVEYNNGC
jgi:hypothetical protein